MKNLFVKIKLANGRMKLQPLEDFAKDIGIEIVVAPEKVETGKKRGSKYSDSEQHGIEGRYLPTPRRSRFVHQNRYRTEKQREWGTDLLL